LGGEIITDERRGDGEIVLDERSMRWQRVEEEKQDGGILGGRFGSGLYRLGRQ